MSLRKSVFGGALALRGKEDSLIAFDALLVDGPAVDLEHPMIRCHTGLDSGLNREMHERGN